MEGLLAHLTTLTPESVYITLVGILLLCGLGVPIPEDISLLAAGYMAYKGVLNVHTACIVCLAAVLTGDTMAFFLGRFFGSRILEGRLSRRIFPPRKQLRVRAYFRKYGSKMIFIGRFLPGLRFSLFFSAGTLRVRAAVFFIYDALAALLSVPALVYLAWIGGEHIERVVIWARRSEWGIVVLLAMAALALVIRAAIKRRRSQQARNPVSLDATAAPPC
jgi:membrane protein DedA with SNARE-associated domain